MRSIILQDNDFIAIFVKGDFENSLEDFFGDVSRSYYNNPDACQIILDDVNIKPGQLSRFINYLFSIGFSGEDKILELKDCKTECDLGHGPVFVIHPDERDLAQSCGINIVNDSQKPRQSCQKAKVDESKQADDNLFQNRIGIKEGRKLVLSPLQNNLRSVGNNLLPGL